jgi:hypothetical protein
MQSPKIFALRQIVQNFLVGISCTVGVEGDRLSRF